MRLVANESNEFNQPVEGELRWSKETPVRYMEEYEIVVCLICGYGLNGRPGIRRHLVSRHSYGWREAKKIEDGFQGLKIVCWKDPRPQERRLEDPPIRYLKLFKNGFRCHFCDHVCLKEGSMLIHLLNAHDWGKPMKRIKRDKQPQPWKNGLWAQSFFPGSGLHYFEVARNQGQNENSTDRMNLTRGEKFRQQLRATLEDREMELKSDAESIRTSSIHTEISLWQEKTRWIDHLSVCIVVVGKNSWQRKV